MKQNSGELQLTSTAVGLVLGGLLVGVYFWLMNSQPTPPLMGNEAATVVERASEIESRAQLEAVNRELDATNLNEIDSELTRIQTQVNY